MTAYEILGLQSTASGDEATERYNLLVRKLKETDLSGSPLVNDRDLRLQQIRAAYEEIIYGIQMPAHLTDPYHQVPDIMPVQKLSLSDVEMLINQNRCEEAITQLNNMSENSANREFLLGLAFWRKGINNEALNHLQQAVTMEPGNKNYVEAYTTLQNAVNKVLQDEKNKKNAQIAGGAALVGTGLCASCMCDACSSSC